MSGSRSEVLYKRAKRVIPGGVNSPVRAFKPHPFFVTHASGSRLYDVDGNAYVDYCLGYGPLILGHDPPEVISAVSEQLARGSLYGAPTELELELAELVKKLVPSVDMLRLVNTGTEATMSAIRTARGYTGRDKIVKFEGCYHGAHDCVLVRMGSGATTFGVPDSLGVPSETTKNTLVLPFNDVDAFERVIGGSKEEIAGVIIEPVMGNAGVIPPKEGYLRAIREVTEELGVVLIFDEVITGFRLSLGGAQEKYGVVPDMTTLGKVMGGGFPIAAFGGKREIMETVAPLGKVYQAGTFSGNPVSVAAGLATLKAIAKDGAFYDQLASNGEEVRRALGEITKDARISAQVNGVASMFQVFFTDQLVVDYRSAKTSDVNKFMRFHSELMRCGVFIPPSQFETCFISAAHTKDDIDRTIEASKLAIGSLRGNRR